MKLEDMEARSFSRVFSSTFAHKNVARRMSPVSGVAQDRTTCLMMCWPRVGRGELIAALAFSRNSGGGAVAASRSASFDEK